MRTFAYLSRVLAFGAFVDLAYCVVHGSPEFVFIQSLACAGVLLFVLCVHIYARVNGVVLMDHMDMLRTSALRDQPSYNTLDAQKRAIRWVIRQTDFALFTALTGRVDPRQRHLPRASGPGPAGGDLLAGAASMVENRKARCVMGWRQPQSRQPRNDVVLLLPVGILLIVIVLLCALSIGDEGWLTKLHQAYKDATEVQQPW